LFGIQRSNAQLKLACLMLSWLVYEARHGGTARPRIQTMNDGSPNQWAIQYLWW
jgi:hypothetical protein